MIPYRVTISVLVIELLSIPAMWLFGHRGNNSLLLLMVTFALFMIWSAPFRRKIDSIIAGFSSRLRKRKILVLSLISMAVALGILHVISNGRFHFWDLDREDSLGTLFGGYLLAANVLVAVYCARYQRQRAGRWKWLAVVALFAAMTVDELSEYHQWVTYNLWYVITGRGSEALIGGVVLWITLLAPLILVITIGLVWFVFGVLFRPSRMFAIVGLAFWVSSQILEAKIGSLFLPYLVEAAVEELFEMVGTTLFLTAFLSQLSLLMLHSTHGPRNAGGGTQVADSSVDQL
jgi:hypothetical protein